MNVVVRLGEVFQRATGRLDLDGVVQRRGEGLQLEADFLEIVAQFLNEPVDNARQKLEALLMTRFAEEGDNRPRVVAHALFETVVRQRADHHREVQADLFFVRLL